MLYFIVCTLMLTRQNQLYYCVRSGRILGDELFGPVRVGDAVFGPDEPATG